MKTVVVYASKHGTAKQYAAWIAEELRAELLEAGSVSYVNSIQNRISRII